MSKAELNRAELSKVERERGFFGEFGGSSLPRAETGFRLSCRSLHRAKNDPEFRQELNYYLKHYVGRQALCTMPAV